MSRESERWRRSDPARDHPIRDFSSFSQNYSRGGRGDPVSHGVKLGYSVLDDQMREGQRLAERLRQGMSPNSASPDAGALIERALNIYRDMGALALAAAEALARGSVLRTPPEAPPAAAAQSPGFVLEMRSARRAAVTLDLRAGAKSPRIGPLQGALQPAVIHSVSCLPGAPPVLRLDIPDDAPAGPYNSVVVESETGAAVGTLTVNISA